jgi:alpha-L-arabinofuranosidase
MKHFLTTFGALCLTVALHASQPNRTDSVYLFTYQTAPAQGGLRVAYSYDRQRWTPLTPERNLVTSDYGTWGAEKRMYHPSVLYTDGQFYAVWQLNERANQFATTCTPDLWLWKPQDYPYMTTSDNVAKPQLNKQGQHFVVTYTTPAGNYYRTQSTDFRQWSPAQAITEQQYNDTRRSVTLNIQGHTVTGTINRVPTDILTQLNLRVADAAQRDQKYGESMRDDATRFQGIQHLEATLDIHPNLSKPISPNLIGIFFEDINYSADGGLYAELIQNRDFEYNNLDRPEWNATSFWELKGEGTTLDIATDQPIHANNPHYAILRTGHALGATLRNTGFDGIVLRQAERYDLSLFLRSLDGRSQKVRVSLMDGDKVLATTTLTASADWRQLGAMLRPTSDATTAQLSIQPLTTGTLAIDFVSLFPRKTFKNRPNGLRPDLAQLLADLHPRFVRFPGGCVSHGNGIDNMYRWRETIGPLWERKPQSNIWGYHQSRGLGFYEYFQFCEDIGAEPLPVLPAGVPCQNSSRGGAGQQGGLPMQEMEAYTQELIDLIEWANGDPKTSALARMRAEAGHPRPFNLKYLGVGNEDLISDVFTERFNYINRRIKAAHPEIQVVGTVGPFFEGSDYEYGWQLARQEHIDIVDEHYYVNPGWYIHNQNFYDRYDRDGTKVYLGEWASRGNRLENALAEALHVTNLERNADVVVMSSYAPLLARHGHTQWNPDLIYFNGTDVFPTVNYYVQQLCGQNAGTRYLPADLAVQSVHDVQGREERKPASADAALRIGSSVVRDEKTGDLILKLVNLTSLRADLSIRPGSLQGYANKAQVSQLGGQPADRDLRPVESTIEVSEHFAYSLPPYTFSVIRIPSARR